MGDLDHKGRFAERWSKVTSLSGITNNQFVICCVEIDTSKTKNELKTL